MGRPERHPKWGQLRPNPQKTGKSAVLFTFRLNTALDLLVDTSVLIDIGRRVSSSLDWFRTVRLHKVGIHALVMMEMVEGCRTRVEIATLRRALAPHPIIHLTEEDSAQALAWFEQFKLSHGIEAQDALIAATAARLRLPFYTLNLKHFRPLPGVDARKPY